MTSELRRLLGFNDLDISEDKYQQHQQQLNTTTCAPSTRHTENNDGSCQLNVIKIPVIQPRSAPADDDAATPTVGTDPHLARRSVYIILMMTVNDASNISSDREHYFVLHVYKNVEFQEL